MPESRTSLKLLGAAFSALAGTTCNAAPSWYVEAQGSATAIVQTVAADGSIAVVGNGGVFNQNDMFYQQPAYQGSADGAQRGNLNPNPPAGQPVRNGLQAADSSTSATATLGALHAVAGADTTVSDYYPTQTQASGQSHASWADQLTFHTGNPLGVDYQYSLTLDDFLTTSVAPNSQGLYTNGKSNASARAELDIQSAPGTPFGQFLRIEDSISQGGVQGRPDLPTLTANHPAARTLTSTIHVYDGMTLSFYQYLSVAADIYNVNGTSGANAGDTAYFDLWTLDADASYTSASGTVYATAGDPSAVPAVPEPSEWAMLLTGIGALAGLRRRRRTR